MMNKVQNKEIVSVSHTPLSKPYSVKLNISSFSVALQITWQALCIYKHQQLPNNPCSWYDV